MGSRQAATATASSVLPAAKLQYRAPVAYKAISMRLEDDPARKQQRLQRFVADTAAAMQVRG